MTWTDSVSFDVLELKTEMKGVQKLRPGRENSFGPQGKRQREEEKGKKVFNEQK